MNKPFKSLLKAESNFSITILWVAGLLLIVYLIFIFGQGSKTDNKYLPQAIINNIISSADESNNNTEDNSVAGPSDNEAFIFVNVNKKHFLTKFTTINPAIDSTGKENSTISQANTSPIKRVTKIIKAPQEKKPSDFSIKPVTGY